MYNPFQINLLEWVIIIITSFWLKKHCINSLEWFCYRQDNFHSGRRIFFSRAKWKVFNDAFSIICYIRPNEATLISKLTSTGLNEPDNARDSSTQTISVLGQYQGCGICGRE